MLTRLERSSLYVSLFSGLTLIVWLVPGKVLVLPGEAHPGVHLQHGGQLVQADMDERHPHIHLGNRDTLVYNHGLINYKDNKTKCLKKLTCEGTLRQVFIRVYRHSQSCWYFRPSFMNYCPSNLLSRSPFLPFPVSKYSIYRQCVAGKGVLSCVGDLFCMSLTPDQIQKLQNWLTTPNKNLGG